MTMKELFRDIRALDDVFGVIYLSSDGDVLYQDLDASTPALPGSKIWRRYLDAMKDVREADLVFSDKRIYIRKADTGFVLVVLGLYGQVALVRLNCDLLLSKLKQASQGGGLRKLFRFGKGKH